MRFILLSPAELAKINHKLPPDTPSVAMLLKIPAGVDTSLYTGATYRDLLNRENFLQQYILRHNAIEVDWTEIIKTESDKIKKRIELASETIFKYCYRFTWDSSLTGHSEGIPAGLLENLERMGEHTGPVCIEIKEINKEDHGKDLIKRLALVASKLNFFIEITDDRFFKSRKSKRILFDALRENNIGVVITDYAGNRKMLHMELTAPRAFIRFVANNMDDSDYLRLDEWVERIREWSEKGIREIWFFVETEDEKYLPELHGYLATQLRRISVY